MMDAASLKAYIKTNKIPDILIFAGDEWEVQRVFIKQIQKVTGLEQKRIDSVTDILQSLKTKAVISKPALYIVRDDKDFITDEKLRNRIQQRLGNNKLILLITKLDERTKFYKAYKDAIIKFEALPTKMLVKYIQKHINLSEQNCNKLIEVCESNYGRILLEIDKIKNYSCENLSEADAFLHLIKEGVIYRPPKDVIFDLVEMILKRDFTKSLKLLNESYASGEATMVMLSVLFNTAKAVLQVQSCSSSDISKSTGLSSWQIMNANKVKGHYKHSELENMLQKIQEVELGIKTGKVEERFAMEYLLLNIM